MPSHRLTAYLYMLIVSLIWGFAGPIIKFTLHDFPPLVFLSYRFAISSAIAFIYFSYAKPRISAKTNWGQICLYSFLGVTLGLGLLFFGFDKTTSLTGSLLSASAPIMVVIAGAIFLHERVSKHEKTGVTIAFLGTLFIVLAPFLVTRAGVALGNVQGNTLIMLSILVDTFASILVKFIVRDHTSPETLTHISFIFGFVTLFPIAVAFHSIDGLLFVIRSAPLSAHLGVWYMALLSGTLAYTLRNKAVKSIEVGETAVFTYLYPLWAAPLAFYWLGETVDGYFWVGATIIGVGVIIAEYKRRTKKPQKRK